MGQRLAGQYAVVTGASRGLGRRLTEALISEGARVAMLARTAPVLEQAAADLGDAALPVVADLSQPADVQRAFERIAAVFGGVDILINNAAQGAPYKIEQLDAAVLQAEMGTNILAPLLCIQQAIPLMRARGGGDIVNISSESAARPFPFLTAYAAMKSAVESFSRGLREELRPDGIRVCCLRSGRMQESGFSGQWSPDQRAIYLREATAMGCYHYAGMPIPPAHTARAIVDIICLPPEAHVDFVELRSNIPHVAA